MADFFQYDDIEVIPTEAFLFNPTTKEDGDNLLRIAEYMGRICYNSKMGSPEQRDAFLTNIIKSGHESVIEHVNCSVIFHIPRSISHQLVRHRAGCAYSQQSQRFVNYSIKNNGKIPVILPIQGIDNEGREIPISNEAVDCVLSMADLAAKQYKSFINSGAKPQVARSVLPNCTATVLGITANLRAWRHILHERLVNKTADPAIRYVMNRLLQRLMVVFPVIFTDINEKLYLNLN